MIVNIINLEKRKDRLLQFTQQAKEQGFEFRRWEGIVIEQMPFAGISRVHKQIVQDAKERGLDRVVIAEDDCVFSAPGAWQYYLDNEPESFDFYFGSVYKSRIENGRIVFGLSGLTLYTVHCRFYDDFLSMKEMNHLDRELGRFALQYEYRVCEPMVCFQSDGYSDNRKQFETYGHLLEGNKLFGQ